MNKDQSKSLLSSIQKITKLTRGQELTADLISYENGSAIDIENAIFKIKDQDTFYLIKIDVETSFISWLGVFKHT